MRFYLWSSLLLLVGFIASLEASPVPIELGWARVNVPVSGYELVVLSTNMNGYEDVVREAVGQGANVLIVAGGPGKVEPLDVDVEPLPGTVYRSVLVAPGRGGVERLLLDYAPLMGVPGREYRPQRGSGFGVAASPRGYYYFYLEEKKGGSIVALVTDPGVLLDNQTLSLIVSRLAPSGRVLWLPERPLYARVAGFFHPASLVWAAVKRLGWLEARSWEDPVARIALALLGFGAGMAVVLVAFSLSEYRGGRGVYELACRPRGRLVGRLAGWARALVWEEECVAGKRGWGPG